MQTLTFFAPNLHMEYHESARQGSYQIRPDKEVTVQSKSHSRAMASNKRCCNKDAVTSVVRAIAGTRPQRLPRSSSNRSRKNCLDYMAYLSNAKQMNVKAHAVLLQLQSPARLRPYRDLPAFRPLSAVCVRPSEGQSHVPIHIKLCMHAHTRMHVARTSGFWSIRRGLVGGAWTSAHGGGASDSRHDNEVVLFAARCLWCVVCSVMYPVCCVLCVVCAVARANLVVRQEAYEVLEYNFSIFRDYGAQLFTTATS
jgi:hypothetical protein